MYKCAYGITAGCSALLIVICLLCKLSMGKLLSLHIAFQYITMIRMQNCEIEIEMVVGWFKVELWVVRGSFWYCACVEGVCVVN